MPRKQIDYSKSIIYKICCKDVNITDIYIGSTTCFRNRKNNHKSSCNNNNSKYYNFNVYKCIRNNGGWNNWDMVMIEEYKCNNNLELHKRERYWIDTLKPTLNGQLPCRNMKEYYLDNKQRLSKKHAQYRIDNKENISEMNKQYRIDNKQKIRQYRIDNKEKIKKHHSQYLICECGIKSQRINLSRHKKSKIHIQLINNPFINMSL